MKRRFLGLFLTVALLCQTLGGIAHAENADDPSAGVAEETVKADESSAKEQTAESNKPDAAQTAAEESTAGRE